MFFLFLGEMALKSKVFKCHSNRPTISSSFSFLRCTKPPNNVLRNEMSFSSHIAPKCHQHHHTNFYLKWESTYFYKLSHLQKLPENAPLYTQYKMCTLDKPGFQSTLWCQIRTARSLLGPVVKYPRVDFCGPCFSLFAPCDFYSDHVFHFNPPAIFIHTAFFQTVTLRVLQC